MANETCFKFIRDGGKRRGAMTVIELHRYLTRQIEQILNDGDKPEDYLVEIREHYLVAPPQHCARDRQEKIVFLVGKF